MGKVLAALIPTAAPPAVETLLLISVQNSGDELLLQAVWATTPDRQRGHRRTDIETVANYADLMRRLAELAPAICRAWN